MMTAQQFVSQCRTYLGTLVWHCGRSRAGVDCIGLPVCAARDLGETPYDEDHYTEDVHSDRLIAGLLINCYTVDTASIQAGDILLFRSHGNPQHVGICTSPTTMIHAWDEVGYVFEHELTPAWRRLLHSAYRWRGW